MSKKDRIYNTEQNEIVDFVFNKEVVSVFPDMVRRSIPGYETIIPLSGLLAANHLKSLPKEHHVAYDLGCSLGASSLALLKQFEHDSLLVFAIDNSSDMIGKAKTLIADKRVIFQQKDILDVKMDKAGVVLANFVLQFIPKTQRNSLLKKIRQSLEPNGLLIISEKINFKNKKNQKLFETTHLDFKRANGYSNVEINQKKDALENIMMPDSEEEQRKRFEEAGFKSVTKWFHCLNWVSYLVETEN